jgi:hypothetical protein
MGIGVGGMGVSVTATAVFVTGIVAGAFVGDGVVVVQDVINNRRMRIL